VGKLEEAYSTSCGRSWSGETPQERSDEEAQRQPRGRIAYEKDGSWSFYILPAESEAPGTEIND
jgi:hypothetical protein